MFKPTDKIRSWIIAQQELREQEKNTSAPKVTKPPLITISRQLGSDWEKSAEQLGRELDWEVWDSEIVDRIANDANVHREIVALLDERTVSAFEEISRALFGDDASMASQTYLRHLVGTIMSIGQQGKAIIVGRGANFILPEALNIRIIASFDYRIDNLMKQDEISAREAERRIVRSDQIRADFIKKVFGADIDDVALYDLILRMDEFSLQGASQIICTATRMKFTDSEI
jgi:cytidylate kinase